MAETKKKGPVTKEKLASIMAAASALTSLNESETNTNESTATPEKKASATPAKSAQKSEATPTKRYIPEHKKPDAALTFPEKVCLLYANAAHHEEKSLTGNPSKRSCFLPNGFRSGSVEILRRKLIKSYLGSPVQLSTESTF